MKKIVLLPTKNEEWIIDTFLQNITAWADMVIIADQHSVDSTRDSIKHYPTVRLIDNPYEGHSNKVRWLLWDTLKEILLTEKAEVGLEHALIYCLDADEIITKQALEWTESEAKKYLISQSGSQRSKIKPLQFIFPWFQICNSYSTYRIDGVWEKSAQMAAFLISLTDELPEYDQKEVVNDHTTRIPTIYANTQYGAESQAITSPFPLLHLQFLAIKRTQLKQAWYMCQELLRHKRDIRDINLQYTQAVHFRDIKLRNINPEYINSIIMPDQAIFQMVDPLRLADIINLFLIHSIQTFEPLDIWHIPELKALFIQEIGRNPRPVLYSKLTRIIHTYAPQPIKNMLKWVLRYITHKH